MKPEKATLQNLESGGGPFKCMFNPTDYTVARSNHWDENRVTGRDVPQLAFTGGGSSQMTMQLLFDVSEEPNGNVRTYVDRLWSMSLIDPNNKNQVTKRARPPLCQFVWGNNWTFIAVIASVSVRYTLFNESGVPVRATADVTFQEAKDFTPEKPTNPSSYATPGHKLRSVRPFDTLPLIAHEEYGNPTLWRHIAEDNHIEDPLDLSPGQILSIPPLT